jgi:hypothetical protein
MTKVDDILAVIDAVVPPTDRLFGPDDRSDMPRPTLRWVVRTEWWCSSCDVRESTRSDIERPPCWDCGRPMERWESRRDDPTRGPAPHWGFP